MSYNKNVYDDAVSKLQERHNLCMLKSRERKDSLAEANPRFSAIETELTLTASKLAAAIREGKGMDAFNKIMMDLLKADIQPEDVLNFVREKLGENKVDNIDDEIRKNQELQARLKQLKDEYELLKYSK